MSELSNNSINRSIHLPVLSKRHDYTRARRYSDFIQESCTDGPDGVNQAKRIIEGLEQQQIQLSTDPLIKLQQLSDTAPTSPQIEKALKTVRDVLRANTLTLLSNGLTPLIYGSLQYGLPKNMDADVILAGLQSNSLERQGALGAEMTAKLISAWEISGLRAIKPRNNDPHVDVLQLGAPIQLDQLMEEGPDDVEHYVQMLLASLTGKPILDTAVNSNTLLQIRNNARTVIESDPLYTVLANCLSEDVLHTYEERKKHV